MRHALLLVATLLLCAPLRAQEATSQVPADSTDPTCSSGDYFVWYNTTTGLWMKCQNGETAPIGIGSASSTVNGSGDGAYSPDRAPSTSATYAPCTDEFKNGASTGTWSWGNQSSTTLNLYGDYARFDSVNDTGTHAYLCAPDNSADWTITAKVMMSDNGSSPSNGGLIFIDGGSIGSPTTVVGFVLRRDGIGSGSAVFGTKASYATTSWTSVGTEAAGLSWFANSTMEFCLQARYVVATKVLSVRFASDCRNWHFNATSTRTFTNHPAGIGIGIESPGSGHSMLDVLWVRTRIDSAGTSGEYLPGS